MRRKMNTATSTFLFCCVGLCQVWYLCVCVCVLSMGSSSKLFWIMQHHWFQDHAWKRLLVSIYQGSLVVTAVRSHTVSWWEKELVCLETRLQRLINAYLVRWTKAGSGALWMISLQWREASCASFITADRLHSRDCSSAVTPRWGMGSYLASLPLDPTGELFL